MCFLVNSNCEHFMGAPVGVIVKDFVRDRGSVSSAIDL